MNLKKKAIPLCECGNVPMIISNDGTALCRSCVGGVKKFPPDQIWYKVVDYLKEIDKPVDPKELVAQTEQEMGEELQDALLQDMGNAPDIPEEQVLQAGVESVEKSWEMVEDVLKSDDMLSDLMAVAAGIWKCNIEIDSFEDPDMRSDYPVVIVRGTVDEDVFIAYSGIVDFYSGDSWERYPVYLAATIGGAPEIQEMQDYFEEAEQLTVEDLEELAEEADDSFFELFNCLPPSFYRLIEVQSDVYILPPNMTGRNEIYVVSRGTLITYAQKLWAEKESDNDEKTQNSTP